MKSTTTCTKYATPDSPAARSVEDGLSPDASPYRLSPLRVGTLRALSSRLEVGAPVDHNRLGLMRVVEGKVCRDRTSHSKELKNPSAAALSKHEPTRPID